MFAFPAGPAIASGTLIDNAGTPVINKEIILIVGTLSIHTFTGPNGAYRFYGAPAGSGKITENGQEFAVSVGPTAPKQVLKLPLQKRPAIKS